MTVRKALLTVVITAAVFTALGALTGFLLGSFAPNYYRGVFSNGQSPQFDPVQVGLGQGVTQGLTGGSIAGLLIVVIVTWQEVRLRRPGQR